MKRMYGYTRVSTLRQGNGVSLDEQKNAIEQFAIRKSFTITQWFSEKQTAAKQGRTEFAKVIKLLKQGRADGLIVHKIDRGARNLRDWADIGDLFDQGVEVHFAHDDIDMSARSGRLSADIQAIVAADYVRNLKEETRKGFYGQLKKGIYPLTAPLGYLNKGAGKLKAIDPVKGPMVKELFERYATDNYSLRMLRNHAESLGLTSQSGGNISISIVHRILRNPFYSGVIKIQTTGEVFPGAHTPLISTELYEKVQQVLSGGHRPLRRVHSYQFRKLFFCHACSRVMVGEKQKENVYYRCHTLNCPTKTVREDRIESQLCRILNNIRISPTVYAVLKKRIFDQSSTSKDIARGAIASNTLQISKINNRLDRLADAFLDGILETEVVERKKQELLLKRKNLEDEIAQIEADKSKVSAHIEKALELLKSPLLSYKSGSSEEKRQLLENLGSNFFICGQKALVELKNPFETLFIGASVPQCRHHRHMTGKKEGICVSDEHISPYKSSRSKKYAATLSDRLIVHYSKGCDFGK